MFNIYNTIINMPRNCDCKKCRHKYRKRCDTKCSNYEAFKSYDCKQSINAYHLKDAKKALEQ